MDIKTAHESIAEVISSLEKVRDCSRLYKKLVEKMEKLLEYPLKKPRTASRQTLRSNHDVSTPSEYYRVSMYLPYIDHLIAELKNRFDSAPKVSKG